MGIEIIHGSRPGDNAIGKRVDSIVQQMEQEKQRQLQASIEAARINAQMAAQRASLAMRNKEVEIDAANAAARNNLSLMGLQLDARRQEMQFATESGRLGQINDQNRNQFVMEAVKSGLLPQEVGASMLFGRDAGRYAGAVMAQQDQSADLAMQLNMRQAAASQAELNPEGQNLYREWASKLSAVLKSQNGIRPDRLNQVRQQLVQEFDALDLRRFQVKTPTIDEDWQQNAKQLDDGSWVVRERTKNGMTWRQINPSKQERQGQQLDLGSYMSDRQNYLKEWNAAASRLVQRREKQMPADGKVPGYPTDDEIQAEMDNHLRRWQSSFQGGGMPMFQGGPTAPMPTEPGAPTAPMPVVPGGPPQGNAAGAQPQQPLVDGLSTNGAAGKMAPAGSFVRVTKEMRQQVEAANPALAELRKIGDPVIDAQVNVLSGVTAAIASGQMSPDDQFAKQAAQRAQMVIQERMAKREEVKNGTIKSKPVDRQRMIEMLPKVNDRMDAALLPSGALFVGPDGKVHKKP